MKRKLITFLLCFAFLLLLAAVFTGYEYFKPSPVVRGSTPSLEGYLVNSFEDAAKEKRFGCAGLVLVEGGQISLARCFGSPNPHAHCDPDSTLFTVGSVSKAVSALGVITLVQKKVLDLDEPVLQYMKRWKFPGTSQHYAQAISIRHLLSHTAGFRDGFGTGGVPLDSPVQSLPEYLDSPLHVNMGRSHPTFATQKPGESFSYSTMGYAVLQLVIEDKFGISFDRFMADSVFKPIGIVRSTYNIEDVIRGGHENWLVANYDEALRIHPHTKHASLPGASLKLTVSDFGAIITAFASNTMVHDSLLQEMYKAQPGTFGSWGSGLQLYGEDNSIVGHGGGAFPRSGASFRLNPITGNGIGIMMAGGTEMIDPYISAWHYWETGEKQFDIRHVYHDHFRSLIIFSLLGCVVIVFLRSR